MHSAPAAWIRLTPAGCTLLLAFLVGCSLFSRRNPQDSPSDATLQAEVLKAVTHEPELRRQQIVVQSRNGVIDLSGTVKTLAIKARAGLVAASIPGVVQVHNDLLTSGSGGS